MRLVHAFVRLTATCRVSTLMCGEQEEVKEELFLPPHACCILGERLPSRQGCDRGAEGKGSMSFCLSVCVCGQGQGQKEGLINPERVGF